MISYLWHGIGFIISTLIGAFVTLYVTKKNNLHKSKQSSIKSASLIRNWILERFNSVVTIRKDLEKRIENIDFLKDYLKVHEDKIINYDDKARLKFIESTQQISPRNHLLSINESIIEKLSNCEVVFFSYEKTIQMLTLLSQSYEQVNIIKNAISRLQDTYLNPKSDNTNDKNIIDFLFILGHYAPEWVAQLQEVESKHKKIFEIFEKNICRPLGIKKMMISNEIISLDKVIEELLSEIATREEEDNNKS